MPAHLHVPGWAEEIRRALDELGRGPDPGCCVPLIDVVERRDGLDVRMELPGVAPDDLTVTVRSGTLVIAGEKRPAHTCGDGAAFHVAERTFGRFLRTVPLRMAFDAGAITATLRNGELHIVVPRIEERRGREIPIRLQVQ